MMAPRSLVEKSANADFPCGMIGFLAGKLMELEVGSKTCAAYSQKNNFQHAKRKGYSCCDQEARDGTFELHIPKFRTGNYFSSFLEPRDMAEKA